MEMIEFNWFDHIFAIFILIVIPALSFRSERMSPDLIESLPPKKHLFYSNGLMLFIGALLVITSWNISERPWSALGIEWIQSNPIVWILSITILFFYFGDILYGYINKNYLKSRMDEMQYIIPVNWDEFKPYIFLAFSAGICEEIVFRGFLITYIFHYIGDMPYGQGIAMVIPALVFSLSHLYQGWWAVLKIFIIALLFGAIFIFSGSLILVILIHIFIDLVSGLAGVMSYKSTLKD
jgi:membrane protease YdiL (CAAX protease family)